jgi:Tol biopolymer transport system component
VFYSASNNLVPNDTNGGYEVFLRDLTLGTTERVNIPSTGGQATAGSFSEQPMISADGRYVVFRSNATNLVPGDTNGLTDIFVRDLLAGTTERVSVGENGQALGGLSGGVAGGGLDVSVISGDGGAIAFASQATNLVFGDTNAVQDIFVRLRP